MDSVVLLESKEEGLTKSFFSIRFWVGSSNSKSPMLESVPPGVCSVSGAAGFSSSLVPEGVISVLVWRRCSSDGWVSTDSGVSASLLGGGKGPCSSEVAARLFVPQEPSDNARTPIRRAMGAGVKSILKSTRRALKVLIIGDSWKS